MRIAVTALFAVLLVVSSVDAATIGTEDFNTDGSGSRYTVVGGGGGGGELWGLSSIDFLATQLSGWEGATYFGGFDLDDPDLPGGFSAGTPRTITLFNVDLTGYTGVTITVELAATGTFDAGVDFFRIIAIDNDTTAETTLDEFAGTGFPTGSVSGTTLTATFADQVYNVPGGITNLGLRLEGWTTSNDEGFGWDNIRIEGAAVPEPGTLALFGLGGLCLAGAAIRRRRRA